MAPYHHRVNTHHKSKRARKIKKFTVFAVLFLFLGASIVGIDWLVTNLRSEDTVVSVESSATVQSARINIFQTPYYRFQADDNWKEVTDELNLSNNTDGSHQYLYRRFDRNFIEHELWVTVNLPEDYKIERHNVPTRVKPVRIEADGSITQLNSTSESCREVLPEENPFLAPHILTQKDVTYYCHPGTNDYNVAVGIPGGTNRLPMPTGNGDVKNTITITYRNITATPDSRQLDLILSTFKSL